MTLLIAKDAVPPEMVLRSEEEETLAKATAVATGAMLASLMGHQVPEGRVGLGMGLLEVAAPGGHLIFWSMVTSLSTANDAAQHVTRQEFKRRNPDATDEDLRGVSGQVVALQVDGHGQFIRDEDKEQHVRWAEEFASSVFRSDTDEAVKLWTGLRAGDRSAMAMAVFSTLELAVEVLQQALLHME